MTILISEKTKKTEKIITEFFDSVIQVLKSSKWKTSNKEELGEIDRNIESVKTIKTRPSSANDYVSYDSKFPITCAGFDKFPIVPSDKNSLFLIFKNVVSSLSNYYKSGLKNNEELLKCLEVWGKWKPNCVLYTALNSVSYFSSLVSVKNLLPLEKTKQTQYA